MTKPERGRSLGSWGADGKMSVPAIVDVSGMPEPEIVIILERLARLGIIALG